MGEIDYTLAKELKDAGFPQEPTTKVGGMTASLSDFYYCRAMGDMGTAFLFLNESEYEERIRESEDPDSPTAEVVKAPTLSELTARCGEEFKSLQRRGSNLGKNTWFAEAFISRYDGNFDKELILRGNGKIPEEAVAKLYLALKKE